MSKEENLTVEDLAFIQKLLMAVKRKQIVLKSTDDVVHYGNLTELLEKSLLILDDHTVFALKRYEKEELPDSDLCITYDKVLDVLDKLKSSYPLTGMKEEADAWFYRWFDAFKSFRSLKKHTVCVDCGKSVRNQLRSEKPRCIKCHREYQKTPEFKAFMSKRYFELEKARGKTKNE